MQKGKPQWWDEAVEFLSNDDILASEAQLLESLIRWYKYSKLEREESFKRLLNLIHMGSIPDLFLKKLSKFLHNAWTYLQD